MFPFISDPAMIVLSLLVGGAIALLGWFSQPLLRRIGIRPLSELYSLPGLKRSARITEQLARAFLIILGVLVIVQGAGPRIGSPEDTYTASMVIAGLEGLIVLAIFGVNLAHWRG